MGKETKGASRCGPAEKAFCGCRVESVVTVDDRGQLVLPKELRERAGIRGGDKFAVISWEKEGTVCCLSLVKVEEFNDMVRSVLGPMLGDLAPRN